MPKVTAKCWTKIKITFRVVRQVFSVHVFFESCVQNHLTLPGKINIINIIKCWCDSDQCSEQESDHIRPFLRIGTIDATEACDFFVQWALWKNIFSIVALLTGHGFLMIYDRGSVCDHLGSKNCKLLCGCLTFISVHVPISISMDMCKCGTRLKQNRAHSRGPLCLCWEESGHL